MKKMKVRKGPGTDGARAKMLKYGGLVVEWMCNFAWEQGEMPEDSSKSIALLYKGKVSRSDCNNYRRIS